jgi:hypothetical protein
MQNILRPTTRRRFLGILGRIAARTAALFLAVKFGSLRESRAATSTPLDDALERSPYVYVSPLQANGKESSCHAELWYAWLDASVVVIVSSDRWKATAVARGLDRARVWVGDHGRWKSWTGGHNEAFREAPHFDARVEKLEDPLMIDRLLAVYEEKYPNEISKWRDRMRSGFADGSRILLRYRAMH